MSKSSPKKCILMKRPSRKLLFSSCLSAFLIGTVVAIAVGWLLVTPMSPLNRGRTLDTIQTWSKTADLPDSCTDLTVETAGGMFTRSFILEFRDSPQNIEAWIAAGPGPSSIKANINGQGWKVYSYPAGGGAVFCEVSVSPKGNLARIRTHWS